MITYQNTDIFTDYTPGDLIVAPVNIVGVAGAGFAKRVANDPVHGLQFRRDYAYACKEKLFIYHRTVLAGSFIFAATKDDWRNPSKLEWIEQICQELGARTFDGNLVIRVPALGCGLGGLKWEDVKWLYEKRLTDSPNTFICYLPK